MSDKLQQLIRDYEDGILELSQVSYGISKLDQEEVNSGTKKDTRIRTALSDYLREPTEPLEDICEQERTKVLLALIRKIKHELSPSESLVFTLVIAQGRTKDYVVKFLGISYATYFRLLKSVQEYLQKFNTDEYKWLNESSSYVEAKKPKDMLRYPMDHFREFYEGQTNKQGNYITHCRIERYLDECFHDESTTCSLCDRVELPCAFDSCKNSCMKKRGKQ